MITYESETPKHFRKTAISTAKRANGNVTDANLLKLAVLPIPCEQIVNKTNPNVAESPEIRVIKIDGIIP